MSTIPNKIDEEYVEQIHEAILSGAEKEGEWFLLAKYTNTTVHIKVHSLKNKEYTVLIRIGDSAQSLTNYKNNLKHGSEYLWEEMPIVSTKTIQEFTWDNGNLISTQEIYNERKLR